MKRPSLMKIELTEDFYSYNDANAIGGTCVDVIFSKYNQ